MLICEEFCPLSFLILNFCPKFPTSTWYLWITADLKRDPPFEWVCSYFQNCVICFHNCVIGDPKICCIWGARILEDDAFPGPRLESYFLAKRTIFSKISAFKQFLWHITGTSRSCEVTCNRWQLLLHVTGSASMQITPSTSKEPIRCRRSRKCWSDIC